MWEGKKLQGESTAKGYIKADTKSSPTFSGPCNELYKPIGQVFLVVISSTRTKC